MSSQSPVMLVAGGTGSIGNEIVRQALLNGWSVVVHGRSDASVNASLARLASTTSATGAQRDRCRGVAVDIEQPVGAGGCPVQHLVTEAAACFGRLDAVVDCVATGPRGGRVVGPFADTDPEAYAAVATLSIVFLQRLAHAALPWLKASQGCLVAIASDAGLFAAPGQTVIGAMRAATVGFVRNLALDVSRDGVRIHCISPGFVIGTHAAQRLAAVSAERLEKARRRAGLGLPCAADIAPAVLFLCGEGARKMTGQVLSINGGMNA